MAASLDEFIGAVVATGLLKEEEEEERVKAEEAKWEEEAKRLAGPVLRDLKARYGIESFGDSVSVEYSLMTTPNGLGLVRVSILVYLDGPAPKEGEDIDHRNFVVTTRPVVNGELEPWPWLYQGGGSHGREEDFAAAVFAACRNGILRRIA